jgi:hypothetical protein
MRVELLLLQLSSIQVFRADTITLSPVPHSRVPGENDDIPKQLEHLRFPIGDSTLLPCGASGATFVLPSLRSLNHRHGGPPHGPWSCGQDVCQRSMYWTVVASHLRSIFLSCAPPTGKNQEQREGKNTLASSASSCLTHATIHGCSWRWRCWAEAQLHTEPLPFFVPY